jgi:hypothetical protein
MNWKNFGLGFLACYAIAGLAQAKSALEIPATTVAGAVYVGVIWMPFNLLPKETAIAMIPNWAYDIEPEFEVVPLEDTPNVEQIS